MAWQTSVLLAEGKTRADMEAIIPDVFTMTKRTIGWQEASSARLDQGIAIGAIPGWGVLWTPNIQVTLFPEVLASASAGGWAFSFVTVGVSDYYGFCMYANGAEIRRLIREQKKVTEDIGVPLPEESTLAWHNDESTIFDLARRLTGVDVTDCELWAKVRFKVATLDI